MATPEPGQPTLPDGVITLRPWRDGDVDEAIAGHDELMAHWFGFPRVVPTRARMQEAIDSWRQGYLLNRELVSFVITHDERLVGSCEVRSHDGTGEVSWTLYAGHRGHGYATRAVRVLCDYALTEQGQGGLGLSRVEAKVEPGNEPSLRVATRAGLRREGVRRVVPGTGDRPETTEYVVLARLSTDPPLTDPDSFRRLLNSFLPRKRAISQLLVRGPAESVLLCQLTYKADWDLPGGVVEVGESPRLAAAREVQEELGVALAPADLLLIDWLPAWRGWDDAVCLVFDGGEQPGDLTDRIVRQAREIRDARFCSLDEARERCADFTLRRIERALGNLGGGASYAESGR
jgi:RimJ/RimL family protein N-acetyltransferase/ADP-ribose pyrophosphatase YjhB (NUDIX family)